LVNVVIKLPVFEVFNACVREIVTEPPAAFARTALGVPRTRGVLPLILEAVERVASSDSAAEIVKEKVLEALPVTFVAVIV
jgi:hypothetical protein